MSLRYQCASNQLSPSFQIVRQQFRLRPGEIARFRLGFKSPCVAGLARDMLATILIPNNHDLAHMIANNPFLHSTTHSSVFIAHGDVRTPTLAKRSHPWT